MKEPKAIWEILVQAFQKKASLFTRLEDPTNVQWTYKTLPSSGEEVIDKEIVTYPDRVITYQYSYDDNGSVTGKEVV